MVGIRTESDIKLMKEAGRINYECHKLLESKVRIGISTKELDEIAEKFITDNGGIPSFKGYDGFPGSICTSINDEVVHGIPSDEVVLYNGDIISIDIGVIYKGFHSDSARTHAVGDIKKETMNLLEHTKQSLYEGLSVIKEGEKLSSISASIEKYAKKNNLGIVRELVGHGVGKSLHEAPDIPNYYDKNDYEDLTLKAGMTLAIEPMLTIGSPEIGILSDGWTIVTQSGKNAAHYEHTVLVTKDGYEILTGE